MTNGLNYADPHFLHISEIPCNLDEQQAVVKKYGDSLIRCEPVQIIRDGDWSGVWRVTRVWGILGRGDKSQVVLLGYVRFDLDDLFIYMRPGLWSNEEMVARWDINTRGGMVSGLRQACETLLLYRMAEMSEL